MIVKEFLQYISTYMTIEELIFALIGLIFIIILWVLGGKEQKQVESINRKVDELGRVVLPFEIRQKLGIEEKNSLTMLIDGERIILQKGQEVDALGRIQIPLNIRQAMQIKEKEELMIDIEENRIVLKKQ